jgi:hypothetical protein
MRVSREELRFDFQGARFRLPRDAALLGWIFDQCLYGEVTGIQCGHWLYHAPTLEAATFFARQAVEELSHVRSFLRLYELAGATPKAAHPVIRFLTSGSMGTDYAEHVGTEMAVGEGMVLMIFYALIDTIDDERMVKLLESASRQEERHVAFGEEQTHALLEKDPSLADYLLGLNLISLTALPKLAGFIERKLGQEHEVLKHLPRFLDALVRSVELRLMRLGILKVPLAQLTFARRAWLVLKARARHFLVALRPKPKLLTQHYLRDPAIGAP